MKIIIHSAAQVNEIIQAMEEKGYPLVVQLTSPKDKRSLEANALYWVWMTVMAKHFEPHGYPDDKEYWHAIMRHKHLGYRSFEGKSGVVEELKSTAGMTVSDFCYYMSQVDAWAADHGVLLPRPEDSAYQEWIDQQNEG